MNANQTPNQTQPLDPAVITAALNEALYTHLVKPKHTCTPASFIHLKNIIRRHRPWFERESYNHALHPAITLLLNLRDSFTQPTHDYLQYVSDWTQILLEWPHVSTEDPSKIAYTQDDRKGESNIQTRTTLGRYIKRHCPTIPDHVLRDFVAVDDTHAGEIGFVHHLQGMIEAVQEGPKSCMRSNHWSEDNHPYNVYLPEYGWHMAARKVKGRVDGRCLCLTQSDKDKYYVRTYKRNLDDPANGYSYADEALEAWLEQQGYTKRDSWPDGAQLAKLTGSHGAYIMPYLDGDNKQVRERSECFEIHCRGEYCADATDGLLETRDTVSCDNCGQQHDLDDASGVGNHCEGGAICPSCCENSYVRAYGRGREQYYVHIDDAVWVGGRHGEYYDEEYIGNYDDICWCEDIEDYRHIDDAWQCDATGNWYSDGEDCVLIDDQKYHPDNAPEVEDEDESEQDDSSN